LEKIRPFLDSVSCVRSILLITCVAFDGAPLKGSPWRMHNDCPQNIYGDGGSGSGALYAGLTTCVPWTNHAAEV